MARSDTSPAAPDFLPDSEGVFPEATEPRPFASWREIRQWCGLSLLIALIMLAGVALSASFADADPSLGQYNILLGADAAFSTPWADLWYLVYRNSLVLGIHFGACIIGAIIGRRHHDHDPLDNLGSYNPNLPEWVSKAALVYAWVVTMSSVVIQVSKIGLIISDFAAYIELAPWLVVLLVLPHAIPELTAIFLPLALFMIQARKNQLRVLGTRSLQAAAVAVPVIAVAACIEVFISPHLIGIFI